MSIRTALESPLGTLTLLSDGTALTGLGLPIWRYPPAEFSNAREDDGAPVFRQTAAWLCAYFARRPLPPMPPLAPGGSAFQRCVWANLTEIPSGTLTTYGALARALEDETGRRVSAQAVGGAVGHNPISILIPCHRVVGSGGSLTGYGGGLDAKIALLTLEGADLAGLHRPDGTAL